MASEKTFGGVPEEVHQFGFSLSGFERDFFALNRGGARFIDISGVTGADSITDGRAAVHADFDNDGDLDLFLTASPPRTGQRREPTHLLYRNNVGHERPFLRVTLEGTRSGRDGWGATVRIKTPRGIQTRVKSAGSGFLSQSDPRLLFGLGDDPTVEWLEVQWPSGEKTRLEGLPPGPSILVREGESRARRITEVRTQLPDPVAPDERRWKGLRIQAGAELPDMPIKALDGTAGTLHQVLASDRPTLLNFWATWCTTCPQEMSELERLNREWRERGDAPLIVGVSLDGDVGLPAVQKTAAHLGITHPMVVGKIEDTGKLFQEGEEGVPLMLLVTPNKRVTQAQMGWNRDSHDWLRSAGIALPDFESRSPASEGSRP